MATFISHPIFGAGVACIFDRTQSKEASQRFIILSTLCQWVPDIDTFSYLFAIDERHPLGHRGLTHSGVFALALAFTVMTIFYRSYRLNRTQWWGCYIWFFVITLFHGIFDALVDAALGVAFFWPLSLERYRFAWRPLMDVPIRFSEFLSIRFWHAQWIECQFFALILACLYVAYRLWKSYLDRSLTSVAAPIEALTSESISS